MRGREFCIGRDASISDQEPPRLAPLHLAVRDRRALADVLPPDDTDFTGALMRTVLEHDLC